LTAWLGITVGALAVVVAAYALVWQSAVRASFPLGERAQAALRRGKRKTMRPPSGKRPRPTTRSVRAAPRGENRKVGAAPRTASLSHPNAKADGTARETTALKRKKPTEAHGRTREETVLKRKQPPSERAVQSLKEKRPVAGETQEVGVLKEKLAAPPHRPRERAPGSRSAAPSACRIDWWRGYVKSEFHAKLRRPDGSETILRSSPPFRWSKPTPPPKDLPRAVHAHATLVAELKAAGWIASGRGEHWYALELQPRQVPARAERTT
jgi:hypothetical protein